MSNVLSQMAAASTTGDQLRTLAGRGSIYSARQSAILDELEAAFLQDGFRSLTIGDLAKRAQCSTRTLYELAPTREELLLLVLSRMWERMGNEVRKAVDETKGYPGKLKAFVTTGVAILWPPFSILLNDIAAYGPASRLFEEQTQGAVDQISALLAEGIRHGAFRPVDTKLVATFLASGAIGATRQSVLDESGTDAVAAVSDLVDLLLSGLVDRNSQ